MNQVNLKFEEKKELEEILNQLVINGGKKFFVNGHVDIYNSSIFVHDILFVYDKNVVRLKLILNKDGNNKANPL